jgi:hypothetical protein
MLTQKQIEQVTAEVCAKFRDAAYDGCADAIANVVPIARKWGRGSTVRGMQQGAEFAEKGAAYETLNTLTAGVLEKIQAYELAVKHAEEEKANKGKGAVARA